jgi:hypothetical protein
LIALLEIPEERPIIFSVVNVTTVLFVIREEASEEVARAMRKLVDRMAKLHFLPAHQLRFLMTAIATTEFEVWRAVFWGVKSAVALRGRKSLPTQRRLRPACIRS